MNSDIKEIEFASPSSLIDDPRNARIHSKKQTAQLMRSIQRFGFNSPVIVRKDGTIVAGHGRVAAAKQLGLETIPIIRVEHLSEAECRAYMLADNKIAANAGWDFELLASELRGLIDLDFDVSLTGFTATEIDLAICAADEANSKSSRKSELENVIPDLPVVPITRPGDLWVLNRHKLLCGDARDPNDYRRLLECGPAHLIFTDPPYNVPIPGHVSGLGKVAHRNFAMACGEMSEEDFTVFLKQTLGLAANACRGGAIAFVCMDWRHISELLAAGEEVFSELKNLCVWAKTNGGMGTFYRSRHELVFVFKVGTGPHTNNFGLGDTGRYRTNVWEYAGISAMSAARSEELEMHPTVKPVALVADAILDCSNRGQIVLDPFGGSGTTLIAAHKTGRTARLIEYDPGYCDTIITRYQKVTGKLARLASSGETFEEVGEARDHANGEAA